MASINHNRNELLLVIMDKCQLSKEDVAKKLGQSISIVEKWTASPDNELFEEIPEKEIQFLLYDLKFDIYEVYD